MVWEDVIFRENVSFCVMVVIANEDLSVAQFVKVGKRMNLYNICDSCCFLISYLAIFSILDGRSNGSAREIFDPDFMGN